MTLLAGVGCRPLTLMCNGESVIQYHAVTFTIGRAIKIDAKRTERSSQKYRFLVVELYTKQ